jgi:alkylation response protein AidB-like acyl-CoA dehydrogenase
LSPGAVTSIAMSEPGSGSDVASLRCKAVKTDGAHLLNGQKTWCSNAHLAVEDWARAFRSAMSVRLLVVVRPPSYANMLGRLLVELK